VYWVSTCSVGIVAAVSFSAISNLRARRAGEGAGVCAARSAVPPRTGFKKGGCG